jgi:hypothetical protein
MTSVNNKRYVTPKTNEGKCHLLVYTRRMKYTMSGGTISGSIASSYNGGVNRQYTTRSGGTWIRQKPAAYSIRWRRPIMREWTKKNRDL